MKVRPRGRDTGECEDLDIVDPAMVRLVAAADTLIELYRSVVHAILMCDTRRAWKRERIIRVLVCHELVHLPVNVPVLRLALNELLKRGDIVRVTEGWYRANWPPPDSVRGEG